MRLSPRALLISLGIVGFSSLALAPACDRANPLYHGAGAGLDDGGAGTTAAGQTGTAGAGGDVGGGGNTGTAGVPLADGGAATGGGAGVDGPVAGCLDNDGDGYGTGAGCLGLDCDDTNKAVTRASSRACYDGKAGTLGIGSCRGGAQTCTDGAWTSCLGQVLPAIGEACNGVDDDCDGTPDDGLGTTSCGLGVCAQTVAACAQGAIGVCLPGDPQSFLDDCDGKDNDCDGAVDEDCTTMCVHVVPAGDDVGANGTVLRPFRTIQNAIAFAAGGLGRPKLVCVAGGPTCFDTNVYTTSDAGTFTMSNGISVYGNYESRTWTRCPFGSQGLPNLTVTLQAKGAKAVVFPATITEKTILDGVHVTRAPNGGGNVTATIGVSVEGAKQVQLSNVVVDDADLVASSTGVSLTAGAEAVIVRSGIFAGAGTTDAIGVRSVGSKPTIVDNCGAFDPTTGRCTATCGPATLGIHGRFATSVGATGIAIDLLDSPNAVVERNAICGAQAKLGAGVRVGGMATNAVLRGNSIVSQGGTVQAFGVMFGACADGAPWVVNNDLIQADTAVTATGARVAAVSASGACHPVIDANLKITGGGEGMPGTSMGVFCGTDGGAASRCVVTNNKLIQGSPSVHPTTSTAVACDGGGCARVAGNRLVGGGGSTVVGLALTTSAALVERNDITGGCGGKSMGVLADDASARLENNVIRGAVCGATGMTADTAGLRVHVATGVGELDVHSNTIDAGGGGSVSRCSGTAVSLGLGAAAPSGARGIFRNNILRAGACTIAAYGFLEESAKVSPRLFENNDLDPTTTPTALYLTGVGKAQTTAAAVNLLAGASGNVSGDPRFAAVGDYHLGSGGSVCVDSGTTKGAPKADFDGKARDDKPDIGAYEH